MLVEILVPLQKIDVDGSVVVDHVMILTMVEVHFFLVEELFEVIPIFVDVGLAVPSLTGFLEYSCIVHGVVRNDYDLDTGVRNMLFDELHIVFDTLEEDFNLCRGVNRIFRIGIVAADIAGGQLVVIVADMTEYFEWRSADEAV